MERAGDEKKEAHPPRSWGLRAMHRIKKTQICVCYFTPDQFALSPARHTEPPLKLVEAWVLVPFSKHS
jgi:hypothetical protein